NEGCGGGGREGALGGHARASGSLGRSAPSKTHTSNTWGRCQNRGPHGPIGNEAINYWSADPPIGVDSVAEAAIQRARVDGAKFGTCVQAHVDVEKENMQSTGSTSSQPLLDTPSSGDSFLFSDDDSEVFLSEEGEGRSSRSVCSLDGGLESPGSQWARDGFGEGSEVSGGHGRSVSGSDSSSSLSLSFSSSSSSSSGLGWSSGDSKGEKEKDKSGGTRGDMLFAQKCLELQGFVRPLLELLNGLKKGRFDKAASAYEEGMCVWCLSSFQQSVAMDRIQRIVGVLQKPHIGEKYLPTLLQIEMMLKLWFPQVTLRPVGTAIPTDLSGQGTSSSNTPPHKHKDQLHIPVKKRRLSWSDTDSSSTPPPVACKQVKVNEKSSQREKEEGGEGSSGCRPQIDQSEKKDGKTSGHKAIHWSEPSLTWVHVAPIFSPPKSCTSHVGRGGAKRGGRGYVLVTIPPPTSRGSPATQDSSISSTTPFSEPVGCQSQPVDTESTNPARGQEQSSPVTTQPSSRAELRPLET
ncbi:hypothetical protein NFI96_032081, partial [Prochilodus magdalenae]